MSARESRPQLGEAGAAEDQVTARSALDSTSLVGAAVEKQLDATLWRLIAGEIGLHDLTPALAGWYTLGYDAGRAAILPQLQGAEADRDRYYRAAYDTPERLRERLDQGARDYWNEFIAGGDGRG